MDTSRSSRLVDAALRCYPARWRRRHGDEAAEVALLLIRDGTPAASIAFSYLAGAAREWITARPGRRLSPVVCALLAATCALGVSAGLLASAGPARAASPSQVGPSQVSHSQVGGGHFHCSTGPPPTAVIPVPGHRQLIVRGAGHVRSC